MARPTNEAKAARDSDLQTRQMVRLIDLALKALSTRLLTTIALIGDCLLFAWSAVTGSWVALSAAVLFAMATWCLVNVHYSGGKDET